MKEKSKQKRARAIGEQQLQRRREKEQRAKEEREQREREQAEFTSDPRAFISSLLRQQAAVRTAREERQRAEASGADGQAGRRSQASKKRMALLASMGGSGGSLESIEKLQRKDKSAFAREAAFGLRDEDWKIYEQVRVPGAPGAAAGDPLAAGAAGAESEEERDQMTRIESKIREYDPEGKLSSDLATGVAAPGDSSSGVTGAAASSSSLIPPTLHSSSRPASSSAAAAGSSHTVPLWVSRVRLPELFFSPGSLLGLQEAGLGEMVARSLAALPVEDHRARLVRNVFVTGGPTLTANFVQRIHAEIRQLRPVDSLIRVYQSTPTVAALPSQWDAWRGGALLCRERPFSELFLTRAEWSEMGVDYLKENHLVTNRYHPTPAGEAPEIARKRKR